MSEGESTSTEKPQPQIGSYRLVQPLGSGGMSSVFLAAHVEGGHEVALKVLPRNLAKNPTLLQRFLREAKSAEALEHPNIVAIYDRGVDKGRHYLVLEYVAGGDLHDRVKAQGPLGIEESIAVIKAVSNGLKYAATRGLIHRDIKPANILMTPSGLVKIIDLGLALQAEEEDERVTREGTTVGTVDFMAPEQARDSRATSERSDIYSLGCTFYYLLTASPPFPGGDLADKLSRHCLKPAPDPRDLRPEISSRLAQLVRRMMAKRPEHRFQTYDELLAELDAVLVSMGVPAEEPLVALIDDDDEGPQQEQPLVALIDDDDEEAPKTEPLVALIDDDDDDDEPQPLWPSLPAPTGKQPSPRGDDFASIAPLSLTDLVSLEDESPKSSQVRRTPVSKPAEPPAPANHVANALLEEEEVVHLAGSAARGSRRYDDSARKWVTTCAVIGVSLMLLIVGTHQLYRAATGSSTPAEDLPPSADDSQPPPAIDEPAPSVAIVRNQPPRPVTRPPAAVSPKKPALANQPKPVKPWVEPSDPVREVVAERECPPALLAKFLPEWARAELPRESPGTFLSVARVLDPRPREPEQRSALHLAFEAIGSGTVEIADNGPFFEDDLLISGDSRLIRARAGYRPIVCPATPRQKYVKEQSAVFVIEGKHLIFDGIDFVVNVQDLSRRQSALFACRGGSLTLRNCTVTVVNPLSHPFSVIRAEESSRPSQVRMEATFVRGAYQSVLDLGEGAAEVAIIRSVLVSGLGPAIVAQRTATTPERAISVFRSLLCGRGPILELALPLPDRRVAPTTFRSLESTFARFAGGATTSLIFTSQEGVGATELVRWSGDANTFIGWGEWLSVGGSRTAKISNLSGVRTAWPGTDGRSQEKVMAWQRLRDLERIVPGDFLALAPERRATLFASATPSPFLLEKTVDVFPRPNVPKVAARALAPPAPRPAAVRAPGAPPPSAVTKPAAKAAPAAPPAERVLLFETAASPWQGDLGLFLREQLRPEDKLVRILVRGIGTFPCTPVRVPDGLSLEIHAEPFKAVGRTMITWTALPGEPADAMIDVKGGDLLLANVHLAGDAAARVKHLIRVQDGHLVLSHCWLSSRSVVEPGTGALLAFRAPGTRPLTAADGPFESPPDLPVCSLIDCILISGGDAVSAELGRGLVALSNCAVASGRNALSLLPAKVARDRFAASLSLERCTFASEKAFLWLGRWPGEAPGPDRPWLVSSRDCAFVAGYNRASAETVLLRVEPESMARGALFWQASNDAYDIIHFRALSNSPPPSSGKLELNRQWIELWGERHMRLVTGAKSVRFFERLNPGEVVPGDLALDPNHHPNRAALNLGADFTRLLVKPTHARPR